MNLKIAISQYFSERGKDFDRMLVVRADGIVVYTSSDIKDEAMSIGALVGGVWQASEALNKQINPANDVVEYRLSFDKSDSGLYILPLTINGKIYYMSTIYKDTFNPALLKRTFRVIKNELEAYLEHENFNSLKVKTGYRSQSESVNGSMNRKDFLFENITDEEIDKLFAFQG